MHSFSAGVTGSSYRWFIPSLAMNLALMDFNDMVLTRQREIKKYPAGGTPDIRAEYSPAKHARYTS